MSPLKTLDISTHPYPQPPSPYTNPYQEPQKPKGCCGCSGCSGCFFGCLVILFVPVVFGLILYFSADLGDPVERMLISSYRSYISSAIKSAPLSSGQKETVFIVDNYVNAYTSLPPEERTKVRREFLRAFYYDLTDKTPREDEVRNLNLFLQKYAPKTVSPP